MNKILNLLLVVLFIGSLNAQESKTIYLLIRGDDIGSSHASNEACIRSYKEGIMQSVEIMAPCAWYPEAVRLLKENPGLDVGIHLTITSEWNEYKWRPLTCCPSLVDSNGYFYPMIWQRDDFPKGTALHDANWKIEEIEKEFRAQIERIKRDIPWVSHLGCHMGCGSCDPRIAELEKKLAIEYDL
ncbi:MAG: ChbG/HpnK family deacetylase, partial [Bacteroidales bacterium]